MPPLDLKSVSDVAGLYVNDVPGPDPLEIHRLQATSHPWPYRTTRKGCRGEAHQQLLKIHRLHATSHKPQATHHAPLERCTGYASYKL
jgi:hypothetical protein